MYILIKICQNNYRYNECISKTKIKLHNYLKRIGYYYSKKINRYINDKNCGLKSGVFGDYLIEKINVI